MRRPISNDAWVPLGHAWLRHFLKLATPAPAVESYVVSGARRTEFRGSRQIDLYPGQYATGDSIISNLRFALRHEPTDLGIMIAALKAIDPKELEAWLRAEPTGAFSRRIWFLYETFVGRKLDIEDAKIGNYVEVLDPVRHIVGDRRNSGRHRVIDNLLGGVGLCPTVRRTGLLKSQIALQFDEKMKRLMESYDPALLARAVGFLYTKETRSSFAIEGEKPSANRTERFIAALKAAPVFDANKAALLRLQGQIVDPRYAAADWRDFQNFVGETVGGYHEEIHFICPRPDDVPALMDAWSALALRMVENDVDPVVAAALVAFSFVFIHPFEDGNGRIHRFLMHYVLAKRGYSPPDTIFPLSAAIERDRRGYDEALESFSKPITEFIRWRWVPNRKISVENDTSDLYRYFDATTLAEYLYDVVDDTIDRDLGKQLRFIANFDHACAAAREIVDMPDRRLSLLVRLCIQNGGHLSAAKRKLFAELTEKEITALESVVQAAMRTEDGNGGYFAPVDAAVD
jgi:hypothetical protein